MVTRPARVGLAQRAIINFLEQDYPDKELIVIGWNIEKLDEVVNAVEHLDTDNQVTVLDVKMSGPLWGLYQLAIEQATGEWLVCWDDDNQNHPGRLVRQMEEIEDRRPLMFCAGLYHFMDSQELFVRTPPEPTHFHNKRKSWYVLPRVNPYTFMLRKDHYFGTPENKQGHPWVDMVAAYYSKGIPATCILNEPGWHVTGVLGGNVRGYDVHRKRALNDGSRLRGLLQSTQKQLREVLDLYRWDESFTVCGADGMAFEYEPKQGWPDNLTPIIEPIDGVTRVTEEL